MARTTLNSTSLLALLRGPSTLTAATFVASLALVACGDPTTEKTEDTGTACNQFTGVGCDDTSADTTDTSTDMTCFRVECSTNSTLSLPNKFHHFRRTTTGVLTTVL